VTHRPRIEGLLVYVTAALLLVPVFHELGIFTKRELTVNGRTRIQTLMELALSAAMVQNRCVQCDIQNDARCALESCVQEVIWMCDKGRS